MTRINAGIRPQELTRQHLLAEHREMKRIPNVILKQGYEKIVESCKTAPSNFKLGEGHVKFFYNKIGYLHRRYLDVRQECLNRGYNVEDYSEPFEEIRTSLPSLYGEWEETSESRLLVQERIRERLSK